MNNSAAINISAYGVSNDSWTETGITFNNAPVSGTSPLSSVIVNNTTAYYELDVSDFIKSQLAGDKVVTLVLKDDTNTDKQLYFNSRENANNKPELFIDLLFLHPLY